MTYFQLGYSRGLVSVRTYAIRSCFLNGNVSRAGELCNIDSQSALDITETRNNVSKSVNQLYILYAKP